jgi:hypothetical protein
MRYDLDLAGLEAVETALVQTAIVRIEHIVHSPAQDVQNAYKAA